jgi:glyoxylase-like metal-dependent hydrolase (beta-lactamase superfamily II)
MNVWHIDVVDVATIPRLPLSGFLPTAKADEFIDVPCFAFVLTSEKGTVVVDTGPDPVRAVRAGFTARGQPRQAMIAALAERGRGPDDVDFVVHTHLHYDHMQNDGLFPRATVVVAEQEARWAAGPAADRFCLSITEFLSQLAGRLRLIDAEQEITPGVTIMPTAGHTPGHQAVLVNTASGTACIAGDLVPLRANIRHPQPGCQDPASVRLFLDRAQRAGWQIIPSHDPAMREAPPSF